MTSESFVSASGLKQKKKESDQAKRPGILLFVSFLSFSVRLAWFACFVVVVVVVFTRQRQQCGKMGGPRGMPVTLQQLAPVLFGRSDVGVGPRSKEEETKKKGSEHGEKFALPALLTTSRNELG